MKTKTIWAALFIFTAMLLIATSSWAKEDGYCYIVGYSYKEKTAYFSPIIVQKVNDTSYNDEQYVSDVELIQKLESQFQSYLSRSVDLNAGQYTISSRGAYKSNIIANGKLKKETDQYKNMGFTIKMAENFVFKN
jgi:hypothetical protein